MVGKAFPDSFFSPLDRGKVLPIILYEYLII